MHSSSHSSPPLQANQSDDKAENLLEQKNERELTLDDVIISPKQGFEINLKRSTSDLIDAIVKEFNSNIKESDKVVSESYYRGQRIKANEVLMVRRNGVQELAGMSNYYLALPLFNWIDDIKVIGAYEVTKIYYGGDGYKKHVVNVPAGKYYRAWSGNQPQLLGQGTHIISDIGFRGDDKIHENNLVDQSDPYIKHSVISILRVPGGKLAEVWFGNQPKLLVSRPEPYVFTSAIFKFVSKNRDPKIIEFWDASEPFIACGSLKRVFPTTGYAFVSYKNGKLEILEPQEKGPRLITSDVHTVNPQPVNIGLTNFTLPSQSTKERLKKENPQATQDQIDFISATTSDNLAVGIQIYLTYQITDLQLALKELITIENLVSHIESRAISVMCTVIQGTQSNELFVSSNYTATRNDKVQEKTEAADANNSLPAYALAESLSLTTSTKQPPPLPEQPSAPSYSSIIQSAQHQLTLDLQRIGIRVDRITLEKYKMLEEAIATKMSQQAIDLAIANGKVRRGEQERIIESNDAARKALVSKIKQDQDNENIISAAQTQAHALKIKTDAQIEAEKNLAKFYHANPIMLELAKMNIEAGAMNNATVFVNAPSMLMGSPQAFFAKDRNSGLRIESVNNEVQKTQVESSKLTMGNSSSQ